MTTPKNRARVDSNVSEPLRDLIEDYIKRFPRLKQRELREIEVEIWERYCKEKSASGYGYEFIHVLRALVGERTNQKSHNFNYRRRLFSFQEPLAQHLARLIDEEKEVLSSIHALGALVEERINATRNTVDHELNQLLALIEDTGEGVWSDRLRNYSRKDLGLTPFIRQGKKQAKSLDAACAVFGKDVVEQYLASKPELEPDLELPSERKSNGVAVRSKKNGKASRSSTAIVLCPRAKDRKHRQPVDRERASKLRELRELFGQYVDVVLSPVPELHRASLDRFLKQDFQLLVNVLHSAVAKYSKQKRQESFPAVASAAGILGMDPNSYTAKTLKARLRDLALAIHPDHNQSPEAAEEMRAVNDAYTTLRKHLETKKESHQSC
jgi:hypothetical protein